MAYDVDAIFKAYPNCVHANSETGAWDIDENPIELDEALLASVQKEVETERYWAGLRVRRNRRLAETDWAALSDVSMTDDIRAYRQALRDLPANTVDPANPVWPTKP
jgi:hypothetical protein